MTAATPAAASPAPASATLPRIGLLGCGWIGRLRLGALVKAGAARIAALADPVPAQRRAAADEAPEVYKRLPEVLAAHAGSIRVQHTLRPLGVAMAGRDVHDPYKD